MTRRDNFHRRNQRGTNHNIQSSCGEFKIRGNVQQVIDRYNALADEATTASDKEMFLQHVEHYTRIKNERLQQNAF